MNKITISVVIPCVPKHIQYLYENIKFINNQTLRPNDIIIALSETTEEVGTKLETDLNNISNIKIIVLSSINKHNASANRNRGGLYSNNDIVSFIDADDETMTDKLGKVVNNMKKYNADFALHGIFGYPSSSYTSNNMNPDEFALFDKNHKPANGRNWLGHHGLNIHTGHITIKRHILDKILYDTTMNYGEDSLFVRQLFQYGYKGVFINEGLVKYNIHRSSSKK